MLCMRAVLLICKVSTYIYNRSVYVSIYSLIRPLIVCHICSFRVQHFQLQEYGQTYREDHYQKDKIFIISFECFTHSLVMMAPAAIPTKFMRP